MWKLAGRTLCTCTRSASSVETSNAEGSHPVFVDKDLHDLLFTFVYSGVGLLVFAAFFWIALRISPIPIIKEIEEDQNTALAILMGAVVVGLSIIIAAAIV